jgi:hypothetical protein
MAAPPVTAIARAARGGVTVDGTSDGLSRFEWLRALRDSELPSSAKLVALMLSTHMAGDGSSCFPSVPTLAMETSLSERCVQKHVRLLCSTGWLTVHTGGGRARPNRYLPSTPLNPERETPKQVRGLPANPADGDSKPRSSRQETPHQLRGRHPIERQETGRGVAARPLEAGGSPLNGGAYRGGGGDGVGANGAPGADPRYRLATLESMATISGRIGIRCACGHYKSPAERVCQICAHVGATKPEVDGGAPDA